MENTQSVRLAKSIQSLHACSGTTIGGETMASIHEHSMSDVKAMPACTKKKPMQPTITQHMDSSGKITAMTKVGCFVIIKAKVEVMLSCGDNVQRKQLHQ